MTKVLRCYAKQEQEQWVAVCIDLGLAAQADSLEQAKYKLESMVKTYIEEAITVHKDYAKQLLTRQAPLSQRLEYAVLKLRYTLHRWLHRPSKGISLFTESMPVRYA